MLTGRSNASQTPYCHVIFIIRRWRQQDPIAKHYNLKKEFENLRQMLATCREQDLVEMERKREETHKFKDEIDKYTDQILIMEGWPRGHTGSDKEQRLTIMQMCNGDEF